jgi:uncharacterized protein YbbC (DUF1343 family)
VTSPVRSGLENFVARFGRYVGSGERLGLIANPTAIDHRFRHAAVWLQELSGRRLKALFGPEHGVFADAQDLVELCDGRDQRTGLRVYSLYGRTLAPTEPMLRHIDTLVFDVQDVGARYYTFIYTMLHAMVACARFDRRLIVLDRPNPIGGVIVQGNVLDPRYRSFVGLHPLAVRHGMTVGELALLFQRELKLAVSLDIVKMTGWRREMLFHETGLPWVLPSPNMPTPETALLYPGGCLVEGTNLSEGRGTTRPFHLIGAPWLDPWRLAKDLEKRGLPGVAFRPCFFTPTFQKHAGKLCGGVEVHVTSRATVDAWMTYLTLIEIARRQDRKRFAWRDPPYEYETEKLPIDILCGTDSVRKHIEAERSVARLAQGFTAAAHAFSITRKPSLLY